MRRIVLLETTQIAPFNELARDLLASRISGSTDNRSRIAKERV